MPGGQRGIQGRKPKASTIIERQRRARRTDSAQHRLPSPPKHLSAAARAEWFRTGRLLREAGLLAKLDATALAAYCIAYARHAEAETMLQGPPGACPNCDPRIAHEGVVACRPPSHLMPEFGMVLRNRRGGIGPSPYIQIANQAMAQMIRLLGELGMTPSSRSRIPRETDERRKGHAQPAGAALPGKDTPTGEMPDPREALNWPVQARRN
jgi:phage terminase small subunit